MGMGDECGLGARAIDRRMQRPFAGWCRMAQPATMGLPLPRFSPSSVMFARSKALTAPGEPPEGVMTMPSGVRALTFPELPTIRPRSANAL